MDEENKNERSMDKSTNTIADAAKMAHNAVGETFHTYLKKIGVNLDLPQVEKSIRDKPLSAVGIAAAAGFVVAGGLTTRPAMAILLLFGRKAAEQTAANLMSDMVQTRTA